MINISAFPFYARHFAKYGFDEMENTIGSK